ncbi:hypothetical protein [Sphingomonas sp. M1-B02]|uniref:hypothetical protein n=1 Tax=Sphingomonas sp. M1-B02 TaxID=3114300 RepID=UPI00223F0E16|nr:hypothetical protein [Sphingomonas sp. S6-11]UZK67601.1 hypothetical protein OKW87_07175 [Sphingomonas sp. S6-11]
MQSRTGRIVIGALSLLALVALASPDHRADIRILTHEQSDASPQRMQAAVDLGLVAVSVLVTWSKRLNH